MSHANISLFVPHIGCPHRCSFCDQVAITGSHNIPHAKDVREAVAKAVSSKKYFAENTEIAFFGGSFTAIDKNYMNELLEAAKPFIDNKTVKGIRISTRPDKIDKDILKTLNYYGVTAIELGAQSMCDDVLEKNFRGHMAKEVEKASKLIKNYGFQLGLQMMTGLYFDTPEKSIYTAEKIAELSPDTVRIYPSVLLKNTYLETLYNNGEYRPQTVEEAAKLCSELVMLFEKKHINVIRVGLHSIEEEKYIAGPWHPAFGEMVENEIYFRIIKNKLSEKGRYLVVVAKGELSKALGQKRINAEKLLNLGYACEFQETDKLSKRNIKVSRM